MRLEFYAPASIGNFAAGFDTLGAALAPLDGSPWGDVVGAEPADTTSLTVAGPHAAELPQDPRDNLVLRSYALFCDALRARQPPQTAARPPRPLAFHLEKNLPTASGLGSSASSVAATLAACQHLHGEPLSRQEIFALAGRAEALVSGSVHFDNVVPALAGGLQLVVPGGGGGSSGDDGAVQDGCEARELPWFEELVLVLVTPRFALPTERSRRALPQAIPLATAVGFAQNLAAFVHALERGDRELFRRCLRDLLAEPYRAALVPGFAAAQAAARAAGAAGCTLSGSGPTLFAVAETPEHGRRVAAALEQALGASGPATSSKLCRIDPTGARLLP